MKRFFGKFKFGFEVWALILFFVIMLPNIIWFAIPAPSDILRADSVTEATDFIGSVCQALMIAALCLLKRTDSEKIKLSPLIVCTAACCAAYWAAWIVYYNGIASSAVILTLTVPPCAAFAFFAADRKNIIALFPLCGFAVCHLIYAVVNFIA